MAAPVRSAITGATISYPEKVVTNKDLEKLVETSDEWIRTRTGIVERRFAEKGQGSSYFAVPAVEELLQKTNTKPEEVDLIIVGTTTPDMVFPPIFQTNSYFAADQGLNVDYQELTLESLVDRILRECL